MLLSVSRDRSAEFRQLTGQNGPLKRLGAYAPSVEQTNRVKAYERLDKINSGVQMALSKRRAIELALAATKRAIQEALHANNLQKMAHFAVIENALRQQRQNHQSDEPNEYAQANRVDTIVDETAAAVLIENNGATKISGQRIFIDGRALVFREQPSMEEARVRAINQIRDDLIRKSELLMQIQEHVAHQAISLDAVERYVSGLEYSIESSSRLLTDVAPRTYLTTRARLRNILPFPLSAESRFQSLVCSLIFGALILFLLGVI